MKIRALFVVCVFACMVSVAFAADQIGTGSEKGSLFILPKIEVRSTPVNIETYIHITNDADSPIDVKCFYQDLEKNKIDLGFELTKHQPLLLDAKTGQSTKGQMSPFPQNITHLVLNIGPDNIAGTADDFATPTPSSNIGEMICWAVNKSETQQVSFNHLFAKATIVNTVTGVTSEYRAWHFPSKLTPGQPIAPSGVIRLSGNASEYYACPKYLASQYTPNQTTLTVGNNNVTYENTFLTVSLCRQDLRQDWEWIVSKLDFDVWNADENKFTNPFKCTDSVQQVELTSGLPDPSLVYHWPSNAGSQFDAIGTQTGYYRVHAVASSACDNLRESRQSTGFVTSTTEGLVGITMSTLSINDNPAMIATNPVGAGRVITGTILWDPSSLTLNKSRSSRNRH